MWELLSRSRSTDPTALVVHYRTGLRILLERVRAAPTIPAPIDTRVEELLGDETRLTWDALYEAEQRLVASMPDAEILAEATRRFVEAEELQVPSLPAVREAFKAAGENEPQKRAAQFRILLDDLQWGYARRRLDRAARTREARALAVIGALVVLLAVAFLAFLSLRAPTNVDALYQILTVAIFGLVGAFFSRMIAARGRTDSTGLQIRLIPIRLAVGVVGALIFYFMMVGGLVTGELFPKITATLKTLDISFAKVIFWSFLAGFSERLVPGTREGADAQARQAKTP